MAAVQYCWNVKYNHPIPYRLIGIDTIILSRKIGLLLIKVLIDQGNKTTHSKSKDKRKG